MTQLDNSTEVALGQIPATLRLTIEVRGAIGYGPTELAAFDDALHTTNIANFNLISLSSVIPAGTLISVEPGPGSVPPAGAWGDRLYVVMAETRSATPGEGVAAGIGWVQEPDTGKGLFVEHQGHDVSVVGHNIDTSLTAMVERRGESFGPIRRHIVNETTPRGSAACALVVATFESQPWLAETPANGRLN